MKKILVIGSMNMDFVTSVPHMPRVGETVLAQGLELVPGGKGANQAYAIGRLGGRAAMLGCLGQDSFGDRLLENLGKAGVDTRGVERRGEASTSMAVIGVDPQGDNSILVLPGANGLVDRAMVDRHLDLLEGCDILAMQLEIPLDTVAYAAKKAKEMGKTVVLDPAPAVPDLPEELYPCLDLIKPNETELSILTGRPFSLETLGDSARLLRQRGGQERAGHPGGGGLVPAGGGRPGDQDPRGQDGAGGGHHRRRGQLSGRGVRGPAGHAHPGQIALSPAAVVVSGGDPPGGPDLHPRPRRAAGSAPKAGPVKKRAVPAGAALSRHRRSTERVTSTWYRQRPIRAGHWSPSCRQRSGYRCHSRFPKPNTSQPSSITACSRAEEISSSN